MITTLAAGAAMAFTAIPFASPAMAQGTTGVVPAHFSSNCPDGYRSGTTTGPRASKNPDPKMCYPETDNPPAVVTRQSISDPCPSGMRPESNTSFWCTTKADLGGWAPEDDAKGANLRKPRNDVRCPVGWQSTRSHNDCFTALPNPPRARLSNGRPCGAGELAEWGVWCTSNYQHLTYDEVEGAGVNDANVYYIITNGSLENGTYFSPEATPFFNSRKSSGTASAISAPSGDQPAAQQAAQCTTDSGSATGAVVGAAVGGEAGAALGGMLGGLGKKKKKKGC
ncbi:hypothetical protein ACLBKT_07355 [Erythrobacter sp. W302b]|uniref:hypothetical protein n=1 Tax=Erythrobacter sp. W302b TaxID=3389874 RepID=UPI00396B2694